MVISFGVTKTSPIITIALRVRKAGEKRKKAKERKGAMEKDRLGELVKVRERERETQREREGDGMREVKGRRWIKMGRVNQRSLEKLFFFPCRPLIRVKNTASRNRTTPPRRAIAAESR